MRMRDQLIVIVAMTLATVAVAANVFAQSQAESHRAENERIAAAAAWAQPIVVSTTSAPDTTFGSTDKTDPPVQADNGASRAPGQNPEDCTPPGQVDRDEDKNTPPGQDRDMCVPPGLDKDKNTPPGQVDRDEDKNTPPGQDKKDEETSTPPGQDKDKDEETSTPPGQDKDKD